jgi:hypothetical protein
MGYEWQDCKIGLWMVVQCPNCVAIVLDVSKLGFVCEVFMNYVTGKGMLVTRNNWNIRMSKLFPITSDTKMVVKHNMNCLEVWK